MFFVEAAKAMLTMVEMFQVKAWSILMWWVMSLFVLNLDSHPGHCGAILGWRLSLTVILVDWSGTVDRLTLGRCHTGEVSAGGVDWSGTED
jgi:hypothetical protein